MGRERECVAAVMVPNGSNVLALQDLLGGNATVSLVVMIEMLQKNMYTWLSCYSKFGASWW
jgi:hypothetical protein